MGWFFRQDAMQVVSYEVLVARYDYEPEAVFQEFSRRLQGTFVFHATADYLHRTTGKNLQADQIAERTVDIFEAFVPLIRVPTPRFVLRRLADVIRGHLDADAFAAIAVPYYYQIPLYLLTNRDQKRVLQAMFEIGMTERSQFAQHVANRLQMALADVQAAIRKGNLAIERVIHNYFSRSEWDDMTEGYLP